MNFNMFEIIRPIKESDLVYLNEWKNDYDTFKYLGGGFQPVSPDEQKFWMKDMISLTGSNKRFMIQPSELDVPVGMIGLYNINSINRTAELGIYIGNKNYQGRGLSQQAYQEIERYAVLVLNLRKIKLFTVSENKRAIALFKKNCYQNVGRLKQERYINGKYRDLLVMEKFIQKEPDDE